MRTIKLKKDGVGVWGYTINGKEFMMFAYDRSVWVMSLAGDPSFSRTFRTLQECKDFLAELEDQELKKVA